MEQTVTYILNGIHQNVEKGKHILSVFVQAILLLLFILYMSIWVCMRLRTSHYHDPIIYGKLNLKYTTKDRDFIRVCTKHKKYTSNGFCTTITKRVSFGKWRIRHKVSLVVRYWKTAQNKKKYISKNNIRF